MESPFRSEAAAFRFLLMTMQLLRGVLQLRTVGNYCLVFPVLLGVKRGNRAGRLGNRPLETGRLLRQLAERIPFRGNPRAQVLDVALGLEDSAGIVA